MTEGIIGYAEFIKLVIDALEAASIDYLIGGAVAAWAWGEPRATLDLDVVVDIPLESIEVLSQELGKRDMLAPADIILNTIIENRADLPIQAIHMVSGYKADIYPLRPGDELRRSALARKIQVDFGPLLGTVYIHSPEDLILYKLWYFSLSQQTKHIRDIAAILRSLGEKIDYRYLDSWITRKGLQDNWQVLLDKIQDSI